MASKDKGKANPEEKPKENFSLVAKIINGGIAGTIGVSVVYPLDLVKTRLQAQQQSAGAIKQYKSMTDCLIKSVKSDGYFGMYRGSAINIILVTPEKAIKLSSNDFFRHKLKPESGPLPTERAMLAGALAGLCQITVTTPMELIIIQLQDAGRLAAQKGQKSSLKGFQVIKNILKNMGPFGLYTGVRATGLRDVTFSMIYFPLFAYFNSLGPRKKNSTEAEFWCSFLSGMLAGSISALSVTPFDVVKTRLQLLRRGKGERAYEGVIDCFKRTFKHEGIKALYKGGACRMMVIAPLFGIAQMVYFVGIGEYLLGLPLP